MIADMPFIPDVLTRVESLSHDKGWDTPAALYGLHAEHLDPTCTAVGVADFPGFSLAMAHAGHCYYAMKAVTQGLRAVPSGTLDLSGLFAVVLVDEVYMVRQGPGQPRPVGSLANHPGRIEQRFAWLLAADGSSKVLTRTRGDGEAVQWPGEWKDGRLVDAARELLLTAMDRT